MELFKEAVDFIKGDESDTGSLDKPPVYEYPASKPFSRHFTMPLPTQVRSIEPINLRATLSNVNFHLLGQLGSGGEIDVLSALLNRLRTQVTQKPLLTDIKSFYVYGCLLKMLSQWFYNTNSSFVSYFDEADTTKVSSLLYEYINVLLFTALRLYTDINAREEWTTATGPQLAQCRLVLEELSACAKFAQCEPFQENSHTNRWHYQRSPSSIGNSGTLPSQTPVLQEDKAGLRRHIDESLGGLAHLEALVLLVEANINEVRALVWEEKLEEESEEEMRASLAYDRFTPHARHVTELYEQIEERIVGFPSSRLLWYAKFQSLYWRIRGELLLVEYEQQYYQTAHDAQDYVQHGQSALKRVEELIRVINTKANKRAAAILKDRSLKAVYDSMLSRVKDLYEELHDSVAGAYGYNPSLVDLMPGSKWEEPARKPEDYTQVAKQQLKEYMQQNDPSGTLDRAFTLLSEMYQSERSFNAVSLPPPPPPLHNEQQQQDVMSNAQKLGHLEERKLCYDWLLLHRNARDEIVLARAETLSLESEMTVIANGLSAHSQTMIKK